MMAEPVMHDGPSMVEVKNIFFKAHTTISYFTDEAEADSVENDVAFQQFNRALECSNKYGCLFLSFQNCFSLLRISDLISSQRNYDLENRSFSDLKKMEIRNEALPTAPNIITLSTGDDYLAVDTVRGDSAWVVIFKLSEFINQGGRSRPLCEIRCSSSAASRISGICWNPGESMSNIVAINVDDGSLFLAKLLGPNNVELTRFAEGGVRCLCWSPKGKQLVIGRMNGNLSQLKLDLTEAKQISKPGSDYVPISILWTQTTQFLTVFHKEASYLDFMQLDLRKGAPPVYTNSGDVFISEVVPAKVNCFFLPFVQWNSVLAMTNSASDVVVLVKESQNNQNELWAPGDIMDSRRAAFLLDNYTRGAAAFYGSEDPVVFSDSESYPPMPILFLLSQRGSLSLYSVINSDQQAPSLISKVTETVPDTLLTRKAAPPAYQDPPEPALQIKEFSSHPQQETQQPTQQGVSAPKPLMSVPSNQTLFTAPTSFAIQQPTFSNPTSQGLPSSLPSVVILPKQFGTAMSVPLPVPAKVYLPSPKPVIPGQIQQTVQKLGEIGKTPPAPVIIMDPRTPRQLGTSTLPTAKDMAGLQKAVEEKRREMTTQLQKGTVLKNLDGDDQCAFVMSEVRKFEQRVAEFTRLMESSKINLAGLISNSFNALEKSVLARLNVVEDFTSDMVSTTSAQKEEVEVLKERILNHFSQLEYAKSLVERNRDPRYLEHLRSRPLDPASQQKFEEVSKLHKYIQNQISECRRFFYEQTQKKDPVFDRVSYSQLIYMTLSNHSKIIRRLHADLDKIKEKLGLGKHNTSLDDAEYLSVCEASYSNNKKGSSFSANTAAGQDDITLNDLTGGISKLKLGMDSDRPDRKPIKLSNRKLLILKKCMPQVSVVKVKADEAPWTRTPMKPTATRPKPMAYPATTFQDSLSKMLDFSERDNSPNLEHSTSTTSRIEPNSLSPSHIAFQAPPPPEAEESAKAKSSAVTSELSLIKNVVISSSRTTMNPTESNTTVVPKPASTNQTSILKPTTQILYVPTSVSPASQSPTLAGLLASPGAMTVTPVTMNKSAVPTVPDSKSKPGTNLFSSASFSGTPSTISSLFGSYSQSGPAIAPVVPISSSRPAISQTMPSLTPVNLSNLTGTASTVPSTTAVTLTQTTTGFVNPLKSEGGVPGTTTSAPVKVDSNVLAIKPTSPASELFSNPIASSKQALPPTLGTSLNVSGGAPEKKATVGSEISLSSISFTTPGESGKILEAAVPDVQGGNGPKAEQGATSPFGSSPFGGSGQQASMFGSSQKPAGGLFATTTSPSAGSIFGGGGSSIFGGSTGTATGSFSSTPPAGGVAQQQTLGFAQTKPAETGTGFGSPTTSNSNPIFGGGATFGSTSVSTASLFGSYSQSGTTIPPVVSTTSTAISPSTLSPTPLSNLTGTTSTNPSTTTVTLTQTTGFVNPLKSEGGIPGTTTSGPAKVDSNVLTINPTSTASGLFSSPITSSQQALPATFGASLNVSVGAPEKKATVGSGIGLSSPLSFLNSGESSKIFGGAAPDSQSGFGAIAEQGATSPFGSNPFGGSGQQQASIFGSPQKPTSGLFATTTSPSSGSIFGGGGSVFGGSTGTATGSFSSTPPAGGVAQQGFGFAQAKPAAAGSGFGSPTTSNPVFGGGATFGSTSPFGGAATFGSTSPFGSGATFGSTSSPFGSSFGSTTSSTFGTGTSGGSVFGGTVAPSSGGFGVLAQQGLTSPGFGGGGFGSAAQPQQQQTSLFGSPSSPQQPPKPVFGGQAFSSWR